MSLVLGSKFYMSTGKKNTGETRSYITENLYGSHLIVHAILQVLLSMHDSNVHLGNDMAVYKALTLYLTPTTLEGLWYQYLSHYMLLHCIIGLVSKWECMGVWVDV